jgi:hypothetical protein
VACFGPRFFLMANDDFQNMLFKQSQQQQMTSGWGGGLGNSSGATGYSFGYGTYFPPTPTITITSVPIPQDHYNPRKGVQIVYRFDKGMVQACLIKGTNNVETAKNVFLGQFTDTAEPEIVAAVEVLLA